MEQIFVYRTSGGKNILSNLSNEVKPIVLTVLEGIPVSYTHLTLPTT